MKDNSLFAFICLSDTLFIIFLLLKIVGVIRWSWWIVTIPFWLPLVVLCVVLLVFVFLDNFNLRGRNK